MCMFVLYWSQTLLHVVLSMACRMERKEIINCGCRSQAVVPVFTLLIVLGSGKVKEVPVAGTWRRLLLLPLCIVLHGLKDGWVRAVVLCGNFASKCSPARLCASVSTP